MRLDWGTGGEARGRVVSFGFLPLARWSGYLGNQTVGHGYLGEELAAEASDVRAIGDYESAIGLVLWSEHAGLNVLERLADVGLQFLLGGVANNHRHLSFSLLYKKYTIRG